MTWPEKARVDDTVSACLLHPSHPHLVDLDISILLRLEQTPSRWMKVDWTQVHCSLSALKEEIPDKRMEYWQNFSKE
jgi:hypothetical protein